MSESEPTQIGDIIRRRRSELGLSPAELGDRVGRTGSTIRRWEKNEGTPPRSLQSTLAKALELEPGQLTAARQTAPEPPVEAAEPLVKAPERPAMPEPSAEKPEPSPSTPEPPPMVSPPPVRRPEPSQPEVSSTPKSDERPPPAPPRSAPPPPPKKQPPAHSAPSLSTGAPTVPARPAASQTPAAPITDLPTEVLAVPSPEPTSEAAALARSTRTRTIPKPPEDALSYVEDPKQRYRYFLRWLLTAAAIVVMLFVLAWAFTELKEALGDVWDLFQQEPTDTTIVGADFSVG